MAFSPESFSDFLRTLNSALESDDLEKEQIEMTGIVRDSVIENFQDKRDYGGAAWEERKKDYDHDPLRETFLLFGAATVRGATGAIENRSRSEVVMGISSDEIEYAAAQNYGYEPNNLPAREYMFVRKEHQERLDEPLEEGMHRVLDEHVERHQS